MEEAPGATSKSRKERLLEAMENQRNNTQPIIQQALLMELVDIMDEQLELTRQTVGRGILQNVGSVQVGSAIVQLDPGSYPTMPWKGINVFNDGPAAYFITVNKDYIDMPTPIRPNEPFNGDFGRDKVKKILLQSATAGAVANLRLFAII